MKHDDSTGFFFHLVLALHWLQYGKLSKKPALISRLGSRLRGDYIRTRNDFNGFTHDTKSERRSINIKEITNRYQGLLCLASLNNQRLFFFFRDNISSHQVRNHRDGLQLYQIQRAPSSPQNKKGQGQQAKYYDNQALH